MKINNKLILIFLITIVVNKNANAQDVLFSQFHNAPLLRNPGLAGVMKKDIRVIGNHRSQWQGFGATPFSTQAASLELRLNNPRNITVGAQFVTDKAGDAGFRRTQILPMLAVYVPLNDYTFINFGTITGPVSTGFDITKLYFDDQYVLGQSGPSLPTSTIFSTTNRNYWDINLGAVINQNFQDGLSWYAGFGAFHVTQPNVGFDAVKVKLPVRLSANAGLNLPLSTNSKIQLQADYFMQNKKGYLQAGGLFQHSLVANADDEDPKMISAGAFIRWNDVVIPTIQFDVTKNFTLGLSYDLTISDQPRVYNVKNGLEIALIYQGNVKERSYLPCPRF